MTYRRGILFVIGLVFAIGALTLVSAQAPAGGQGKGGAQGKGRGGAPAYTPAPGAKDLKAVLFNWAWYMGMLRSSEEYDLIMSLEYQGKAPFKWTGSPAM